MGQIANLINEHFPKACASELFAGCFPVTYHQGNEDDSFLGFEAHGMEPSSSKRPVTVGRS
ncbi:uncharacterized protein METZ01_LOCUS185110 [marine metagenome]|uniref:Uncharacterized protein n=1 Tax=marine metagenome TaxID=408172 RepID=A0A382D1A4_9ZZZZ